MGFGDVLGQLTMKLNLLKASPKGPCAHIAYTLGPMYLYRECFKDNIYIYTHYVSTWTLGDLYTNRVSPCKDPTEIL